MNKIVILSDGTGNGAAKKEKTNVWRLYRALDQLSSGQLAYYDDGVGSRDGIFSKVLGGAFGFGLKHNVLEMYKFLCRVYNHETSNEDSDQIYLFGFSRGAFTIRVLADFVIEEGLINCHGYNEKQLDQQARQNYSNYRRKYKGGLLYGLYNLLFDRNPKPKCHSNPNIKFVGVWDTVDAYALPIDELAILWHKWIYPIRFTNFEPSKHVDRACHAISIDDERHTFHPVLWDESGENGEKVTQVWFAGVHANVGGGYPNDSLSYIPLIWMMTEASKNGLRFIGSVVDEFQSQADAHGPAHNSRSGGGAFYRFKPRNIEALCSPVDGSVRIGKPKIHSSVLSRIQTQVYPYAPTALPEHYVVEDGTSLESTHQQAIRQQKNATRLRRNFLATGSLPVVIVLDCATSLQSVLLRRCNWRCM